MRYALAILTHGVGGGHTLPAAIDGFRAHVSPKPTSVIVYGDGSGLIAPRGGRPSLAVKLDAALPTDWLPRRRLTVSVQQEGFCAATAALWARVSEEDVEFVFWLEHDFVIERHLNLTDPAGLLAFDKGLAQIALVRNPVNETEIAAGGLIESRPGEFVEEAYLGLPWLEHRSFFTTNPSFMRADFMREHPFPDGGPHCEGHYGIGLVEQGFRFCFWGAGEQWCRHIGVRDGHGY